MQVNFSSPIIIIIISSSSSLGRGKINQTSIPPLENTMMRRKVFSYYMYVIITFSRRRLGINRVSRVSLSGSNQR